jgi:hypothetical protein
LVLLGSVTVVAHGQESGPKGFYKKDYAIAPGAPGRDDTQLGKEISPQQPRPTMQQSPSSNIRNQGRGSQRKRRIVLSVYVNSVDKEHLAEVLTEVLALNDEKTAFISSFNHVGDYKNVTPEMEGELTKRGIKIVAVSEPPYAAQVTVSPAWFIQTQKGTHIAEGIVSIHSFFNEYGEYEPKRLPEQDRKNSMEGF